MPNVEDEGFRLLLLLLTQNKLSFRICRVPCSFQPQALAQVFFFPRPRTHLVFLLLPRRR